MKEQVKGKTNSVWNLFRVLGINYLLFGLTIYFVYVMNRPFAPDFVIAFYVVLLLLFCGFGLAIYFISPSVAQSRKSLCVVCCIMLVSYGMILTIAHGIDLYLAPFALCALLVSLLVNVRISYFSNIYLVLIYFIGELMFRVGEVSLETSVYTLVNGFLVSIIAGYVGKKHLRRLSYLTVGCFMSLCSVFCAYATHYMFGWSSDDIAILFMGLNAFSGNFFNIGLFFLLAPLFEKVFNLVTDFRLAELASTDHPLLRKLFNEAPGTYNHSLVVANYAEACAAAIGEDVFLARAAGYYHDIGKLKNPQYFAENQVDGYNPHDEITPDLSVSFIKKHTLNGYVLAQEYHLPEEIQDVILEHHGTMPIKYFYLKAKKYTEGELSEEDFRYDGPTPHTKIAAIIMICDTCEAALRTLKADEKYKAKALIQNLIRERLLYDQFNDCNITMKELNTISNVIASAYLGVSHQRIKYQDQKEMEREKDEN